MSSNRLSTSDLYRYIPHRPPMVWIDWVDRFGATEGACTVDVKADALYMSAEGVRPTALIEFMAQTYGFVWICHVTRNVDPTSKGMAVAMLAAFKNVTFAPAAAFTRVRPSDQLHCSVFNMRRMGPITSFRGHVEHNGVVLAEADMRTYSE